MPTRKYAPGEEIRRHAQAIGRPLRPVRDALFRTEVTGLSWDDEAARWTVRTDRGDEIRARYVVISSGPFNRPKLPGIPGIEDFRGHTFHTSRWDYAFTGGSADGGLDRLADRRVAVIGTGATAIQVVPHLARDAAHLYVVQRTPSTVDERGDRETDPDWWASLEPGWQRAAGRTSSQLVDGRRRRRRPRRRPLDRHRPRPRPPHSAAATGLEDTGAGGGARRRPEDGRDLRARVDALVDDPGHRRGRSSPGTARCASGPPSPTATCRRSTATT